MILYHAEGSPHSASVRIALAEKGLSYEERPVRLSELEQLGADFLAINPAGQLPVLEDGACRIAETLHILRYLDEAYPQPPLRSATAQGRYGALKWGKYVETHIAPHLALLTWNASPDAPRPAAAALDALPPERRAQWQNAIAGFSAEDVANAEQAIARAAGRIADDLAQAPWLSGDRFGLADIAALPHARRFEGAGIAPPAPILEWLEHAARRPAVAADTGRDRPIATMGPERARWG